MDEFQCFQLLHETRLKDWTLLRGKDCICEFVLPCNPLRVDTIRINKNENSYSYKHTVRYYRGSWPRYLEKDEHVIKEESGFASLVDLFDALEDPPYPKFQNVRFTFFEKNE